MNLSTITLYDALKSVLGCVQSSQDSVYSPVNKHRIETDLSSILDAINSDLSFDQRRLWLFIGPTGAIQEISIENGWGEEFLRLSKVIDGYLERKDSIE